MRQKSAFKKIKGRLPQTLLGPFLNTLSQMNLTELINSHPSEIIKVF